MWLIFWIPAGGAAGCALANKEKIWAKARPTKRDERPWRGSSIWRPPRANLAQIGTCAIVAAMRVRVKWNCTFAFATLKIEDSRMGTSMGRGHFVPKPNL